jgi:hypothetical protein
MVIKKADKAEIEDALNENYKNLLCAIYRQAVSDDYKKVCKAVSETLTMRGINKLRVRDYISSRTDEIRVCIQKNVYEEAQNYGYGTRKIQASSISNLVIRIVSEFYNEGR